jgi:hypothetical protein
MLGEIYSILNKRGGWRGKEKVFNNMKLINMILRFHSRSLDLITNGFFSAIGSLLWIYLWHFYMIFQLSSCVCSKACECRDGLCKDKFYPVCFSTRKTIRILLTVSYHHPPHTFMSSNKSVISRYYYAHANVWVRCSLLLYGTCETSLINYCTISFHDCFPLSSSSRCRCYKSLNSG